MAGDPVGAGHVALALGSGFRQPEGQAGVEVASLVVAVGRQLVYQLQALGIFHRGRMLVFYSYESDLGDGWEDSGVHDDPATTREAAIRMGVNLFLYVLGQSAS